jgi:SAM-dependent methyltransferase
MTRVEKILHGLSLDIVRGVEIGALDKPIVPPSTPHIFYVDHADTMALREKCKDDANVDIEKIVHVGGVWGEKTLAEIAAAVVPVDYVVASHVIEHVPDLITWLQEIKSILKPDGQLRLAVPDRRYSFDLLRQETQIADVLNAYLVRARLPQPREVIDSLLHASHVDCAKAWAGTVDVNRLEMYYPQETALYAARQVIDEGRYHDVHCWVFTPWSFANLMMKLAAMGHQSYKCMTFFDTELNTNEFIVTMALCTDADEIVMSWKEMQAKIEAKVV